MSGTGPGSGTRWFCSPPTPRSPPPSLRGRAGEAQERGNATQGGGRAARGADRQGRPSKRRDAAAQGCGSPYAALRGGGGGALEPGLHSASAVIGRGGRPTPHSRTCICGRGWGNTQPEIWAGSLLIGSHIGRRPRSFRPAAIRSGGRGGGVRTLYICIHPYIVELSPANHLVPSIALASKA